MRALVNFRNVQPVQRASAGPSRRSAAWLDLGRWRKRFAAEVAAGSLNAARIVGGRRIEGHPNHHTRWEDVVVRRIADPFRPVACSAPSISTHRGVAVSTTAAAADDRPRYQRRRVLDPRIVAASRPCVSATVIPDRRIAGSGVIKRGMRPGGRSASPDRFSPGHLGR